MINYHISPYAITEEYIIISRMQEKKQFQEPLGPQFRSNYVATNKKSDYIQTYNIFFAQLIENVTPSQQIEVQKLLQKQGIQISKDHNSVFSFQIQNHSPNFQVVEIKLSWGYYHMNAFVLNISGASLFHSCSFSCGANAKVYHVNQEGNSFSVKCIPVAGNNVQTETIMKIRALKEYFIFKITSALGIGPFLTKYFGFDIIFSQHCIQFAIQTCKPVKKLSNQAINNMKANLLILHQCRIVHFDIKPDNIMWSNHFKRQVFIDFGLSEIMNGEAGYKYLVQFKGSPNFCSPQMSSLLVSQLESYIDVYYNDVYCLKQSLKFFKMSSFQCIDETFKFIIIQQIQNDQSLQQDLYVEQHFLHHQNVSLKITKLKYYIYTKNHQKIEQLYHENASNVSIFSGQVLEFLRDNTQIFQLKEFYLKYIPESVRQSIENGWIQGWIRSVYPTALIQKQLQLSEEITDFFRLHQNLMMISKQEKCSLQSMGRIELEQILYTDKVIDVAAYCYYFVNFISFINNRFRVDIDCKLRVCQHFIMLLLPQQANLQIEDEDGGQLIILKYLKLISVFIVNCIRENIFSQNSSLNSSNKLQLCLNIIQHIFFFDLFDTQQALFTIDCLYSLQLWSNFQRLQFLITILNNNIWNLFSLFSKESISDSIIGRWCSDNIRKLGKRNLQQQCRNIYDVFVEITEKRIESLQSDEKINSLPISLKMQIWLSRFPMQFYNVRQYPVLKIKQFISQHFPRSQQNRLLAIYIYLFGLFNIGYANTQQCESICQLFKRNLLSDQLLERLIIMRFVKTHQTLRTRISEITHFSRLITRQNSGFLVLILARQLELLSSKIKQTSMLELISYGLDDLIKQLLNTTLRLDFRLEALSKQSQSITQNKGYIFIYFTLQNKIHELLRRPYRHFREELEQLKEIIQQLTCEKTRKNVYLEYLRLKMEQAIMNTGSDPIQNLLNLLHQHVELKSNNQEQKKTYSQNRVYLSVIKKLMMLKCYDQRLLNVISQFYRYSKQKSLLENYMESIQIPQFISFSLVVIFQLQGFQEMIYYIKATLKYIHYTESNFNLSCMINNYITFFLNLKIRSQPNLTSRILSTLKQLQRKQSYIAALYLSYMKTITSADEICYYLKKICVTIRSMPLRIAIYFQVMIYRYIIHQQSQICQSIIDTSAFSKNRGRKTRKMIKLEVKLTKLLSACYRDHNYVKSIQIKPPNKISCPKQKMLSSFCRKFGAYKFQDHKTKTIRVKAVFK